MNPTNEDTENVARTGTCAVVLPLRVRYAETDQMGVVHHANYLVWFEAARSEFCRSRGIDYSQMERDGLILPILEAHCRYLMPAHYEDEVTIRAEVVEIRRSLMRIEYDVKRGNDTLATGETLQMLVDSRTRRPRRFPADLAERFTGARLEISEELSPRRIYENRR